MSNYTFIFGAEFGFDLAGADSGILILKFLGNLISNSSDPLASHKRVSTCISVPIICENCRPWREMPQKSKDIKINQSSLI